VKHNAVGPGPSTRGFDGAIERKTEFRAGQDVEATSSSNLLLLALAAEASAGLFFSERIPGADPVVGKAMAEKPVQILLVDADDDLAEMIVRCMGDACWGEVTHVASASDAMREELTTRHDVMIACMSLPDGDGLGLTREIRVTNKCPVILIGEQPTADEAIDALRLGVTDFMVKPFDIVDLMGIARKSADRQLHRRHRHRRYRRLRSMVSRIIRERRDLRQRMDLICRDLVHAYRNLAQKVARSGILTHEGQE
jgi:PleD family two-component response regulator